MSEVSEFDYVIVGAGSAGCVLANRLSADGKNSVLLLEAGPRDSNIWIHIPLGYGKLFKDKSVNWMYQTEPEPGLDGRSIFQPRGKVLGGSSSINGLLYVRGQHEDYDRWRQHGNSGWGYDDVLPYFKKAENQQRGADDFHGVGRPVAGFGLAASRSALGSLRCRSGRNRYPDESGFQRCRAGRRRVFPDHDTSRQAGKHGKYPIFGPAKGRRNLRVETSALAQRILFEGRRAGRSSTGRAAPCAPRGRERKYWFRAARTIRRNCCSSPASAPPSCCASTASMSCWMRRGSATICRITCRSGW